MKKTFDDLIWQVKHCSMKKVAVACAQDDAVLEAVKAAKERNIADSILVGDEEKIREIGASLEMNMDDLTYLGEADISVEYTSYLWGLFSDIESVNGNLYDSAHQKKLYIPNGNALFRDEKLSHAAYKLIEQFPAAVYFQVVFETSAEEKMFLGKLCKKTAKVKAYKFKN